MLLLLRVFLLRVPLLRVLLVCVLLRRGLILLPCVLPGGRVIRLIFWAPVGVQCSIKFFACPLTSGRDSIDHPPYVRGGRKFHTLHLPPWGRG